MATKKKATSKGVSKGFKGVQERVASADKTHERIAKYAHGKEPQDVTVPEELHGFMGSSFTTPLSLPDPNDDAARVPLTEVLKFKNEGVATGDPGEIVRRAWEAPPSTPTSRGGFMERYKGSGKLVPTESTQSDVFEKRMGELSTDPKFAGSRKELGVPSRSSSTTIFGKMVGSRLEHFGDQFTDWYEGPRVGMTPEGYPQYQEGKSVEAIRKRAKTAGVPESELRRAVAVSSPKTKWVTKSGHMPNIEGAAVTAEIALSNPEKTPSEVSSEMKKMFESRKKDKSTITGPGGERVTKSIRGEETRPWERIKPAEDKPLPAEKISNFDLALSNPYHPEYGYSAYIASLRAQAHTGDTHDLGAAGFKTPSIPVTKDGEVALNRAGRIIKSNAGEDWLGKPAGMDILTASARVATAEAFERDFQAVHQQHGPDAAFRWARSNASRYSPSNAQATMWEESQSRGLKKVSKRRAEQRRAKKS